MYIGTIGKPTGGFLLKMETAIAATLIVASLIMGGLIGTSVAYAHVAWWDSEEGIGVSETATHTRGNYVNFQYDADHVVEADADYPDTTEFTIYDAHFYNGEADSNVIFGQTYIFASEGGELLTSLDFWCTAVDDVDTRKLTYWSTDDLGSSNNHVAFEQYLWKTTASGSCALADSVKHYEAWQTS